MMIIKDLLSIQQIPSETLEEIHGGGFDCDVDVDLDGLDLDNPPLDVVFVETIELDLVADFIDNFIQ